MTSINKMGWDNVKVNVNIYIVVVKYIDLVRNPSLSHLTNTLLIHLKD
jgi:hypothetical protein